MQAAAAGGSSGGGDDCQVCAAAGNLWVKVSGGRGQEYTGHMGGFSHESEHDLANIWTEIGESDADKDCMLFELEKECMQVYRKKVDEASNMKACLHQSVAAKEAELAALRASLGEHGHHAQGIHLGNPRQLEDIVGIASQ